jgi:hypothetical protein
MSSSPSGVTIQDLRNALISLRETGQLEHFLHETFQSHETAGGTMSDSSKRRAEALESEEDEFDVISSVSMKQPPVRRVQTGGSQGHLKVTEPEMRRNFQRASSLWSSGAALSATSRKSRAVR